MQRIKTYSILLIGLLISLGTRAGKENFLQRLEGTNLAQGKVLSITDAKYHFMKANGGTAANAAWKNTFKVKQAKAYFQLGHDEYLQTQLLPDYKLEVKIRITPFDLNGTPGTAIDRTLKVDYTNNSAVNIHRDVAVVDNYHYFTVTVVSITDDQGNPVQTPENVHLEGRLEIERYYAFNPLSQIPSGTLTHTAVNLDASGTADQLQLKWNFLTGAEYYEIEWTHINNYTKNGGGAAAGSIALTDFDFEHNSTRVRIRENFYNINLVFDQGFVVYRVRGVGIGGSDLNKEIFGLWSSNNGSVKATVQNWPNRFEINSAQTHEKYLNWKYSATYAEEGRKKESMVYADGSSRVRQEITKLNSINKTAVGEQIYDFEGRPAVQVMMTPSEESVLKYFPKYNLNDSTIPQPYSRLDFDLDHSGCGVTAKGMSTQSGSSKYYSSNAGAAPAGRPWQNYVPDANKFPFVHTEYTPDNTGRIRSQGQAGATHQLGGGHESRMFYGQPNQEELDRLFGYNVGYKSRYQKNATVDANGQVSVTYIAPDGKTIATALAGEKPANLHGLPGSSTVATIVKVDVLGKIASNDTDTQADDNNLFNSGAFGANKDGLGASTSHLVVQDQTAISLKYNIVPPTYEAQCNPASKLEMPVAYDLKINAKDLCGDVVLNGGIVEVTGVKTGGTTTFNKLTNNMKIGQYQISKELTVNPTVFEQNKQAYITYMQDNGCVKTLTDFQDYFIAQIDSVGCDETCESCLKDLMPAGAGITVTGTETETTWMGYYGSAASNTLNTVIGGLYTEKQWREAYQDCTEACDDGYTSPCEAMKKTMLADMRPGGQYGLVMDNSGNINPSVHTLSIFNPNNQLGGSFVGISFLDADGVTTHQYTSSEAGKLITEWQDQWATQLLQFHPEYCYVEWCEAADDPYATAPNGVSSNRFNFDITNITDQTQLQAYLTGFTGLNDPTTQLFAADPFFKSNYGNGMMASNFSFQAGTAPAVSIGYHAFVHQIMNDKLNNYKTAGESMWDFVARGIRNRGWYGVPLQTNSTALNAAQFNEAWNMFKFLYLSEKQKIAQELGAYHAVENKCYNGCIGDVIPGFPFAHGFLNQFVDLTNTQPCNITKAGNYEKKERRFVVAEALVDVSGDPKDVIKRLENSGDYQLYQNTGQCPNDFDLEFLLNGLANRDKVAKTTTALQTIPEFTVQLYRNISGLNPEVDTYEQYNWNPSITNNTQLDVNFTIPSGTPRFATNVQTCLSSRPLFRLNIQNNSFQPTALNWNDYGTVWRIERFQDLSSTTGTPSTFSVLAKIAFLAGAPSSLQNTKMEVVISGETCVKLGGCETVLSNDQNAINTTINAQNGFANPCPANNVLNGVVYFYKKWLMNGASGSLQLDVNSSNQLTDLGSYLNANGSDQLIWDPTNAANTQFKISFQGKTLFVNLAPVSPLTTIPAFTSITNVYPVSDQLAELDIERISLSNGIPVTTKHKINISLTDVSGAPVILTDCCKLPNYTQQQVSTQLITNGDFEQGNTAPTHFTNGYTYSGSSNSLTFDQYTISSNPSVLSSFVSCTQDHTPNGTQALVVYNKSDQNKVAYETTIQLTPGKTYNLSFWWSLFWQRGAINGDNGAIQYKAYLGNTELTYKQFRKVSYCSWQQETLSFTATQTNHTIKIAFWGSIASNPGTIFGLDDISLEESGTQCVPCTTEAPLTVDCYSQYNNYKNYFSTIQSNVPNLFILSEEDFCAGNYKYYSNEFIAYHQSLYANIGDSLITPGTSYYLSWPQLITGNYGPFVTHYINYVAGLNYPKSGQAGYISLADFAGHGISAQCVTDYLAALAGSSVSQLGSIVAFCGQQAKLNPCPRFHKVDPPVVNLPNPCETYLTNVAMLNAQSQYDLYIDGISKSFENDYLDFALSEVVEQFDIEYADKEYHYTLYNYDQMGNLVRTIPPAGVKRLNLNASQSGSTLGQLIKQHRVSGTTGHNPTLLPQHIMATTYKYNTLNQLVWQETPDGGVSQFWYDRLGRIIASQDAAQYPHKYSFTSYDEQGRVSKSGQFTYALSLTDAIINTPNYPFNIVTGSNSKIQDYREVTYSIESSASVLSNFTDGQNHLRNRVAKQAYYEEYDVSSALGKEGQLTNANHFCYSIHGNVVEYLIENSLMPKGHRYKLIRNEYDLIGGQVKHYAYQPGKSDAFYHEYEYDKDLRLTNVHTSSDLVNWQQDAKYFFYDHGPQAREELGEYKVQAVDKAYTINSRLKAINGNILNENVDIGHDGFTVNSSTINTGINRYVGADAYGTSEHYFTGDYTSRTGNHDHFLSNALASVTPLLSQANSMYNGNIGMEAVVLKDINEDAISPMIKTYHYDPINRIRAMKPYLNHSGTSNYSAISNNGGEYEVLYTYDGNGNILSLDRNAQNLSGNSNMDNLTYFYYKKDGTVYNPQTTSIPSNATNRLAYITDGDGNKRGGDVTGHTGANYTYYPNGNLRSDFGAGINEIVWTKDNKVKSIQRIPSSTMPNIEYVYNFGGERIAKIVKTNPLNPSMDKTTYYVRKAEGDIVASYYENKGQSLVGADPKLPSFRTDEHYIYGNGRVGVTNLWKKQNQTASKTDALSTKKYQISNLRADVVIAIIGKKVISNNNNFNVLAFEPDVQNYSDYYPFGMEMIGRKGNTGEYKFGFQGQEVDPEIKGEGNALNYKYRMVDPRIGRFFMIDPLSDKYPHNSPYAFSENRVIDGVELEGLEVQTIDEQRQGGVTTQLTIKRKNSPDGKLHRKQTITNINVDGTGGITSTDAPISNTATHRIEGVSSILPQTMQNRIRMEMGSPSNPTTPTDENGRGNTNTIVIPISGQFDNAYRQVKRDAAGVAQPVINAADIASQTQALVTSITNVINNGGSAVAGTAAAGTITVAPKNTMKVLISSGGQPGTDAAAMNAAAILRGIEEFQGIEFAVGINLSTPNSMNSVYINPTQNGTIRRRGIIMVPGQDFATPVETQAIR